MPTKKELRLYGDLIYQHKPTVRTVVRKMLLDYFIKKNRNRRSPYIDNVPLEQVVAENSAPPPEMQHFAIIKDGVVEEIIVVNQAIAEVLRYKRIKFVGFKPSSELVYRGMKFENNQFVNETKSLDKDEEINEKD